jgi:hypothetical protein
MKLKSIQELKHDKAEGGLSIFLSVIVMVFIIGLLVMIFALMGGELKDATTDATADDIIGNTTEAISDATDWFPLFIVIAAMVAIILLTVLIIVAIRGSGLMQAAA